MSLGDMGVVEILGQHVLDGGSVVVAVNDDQTERNSNKVDDVVDETPCLVTGHPVDICGDS